MREYNIKTTNRIEMVNLDRIVQQAIAESGVKEGFCVVFAPHTTAGITINENADPDVQEDILKELSKLIPYSGHYAHTEGNADAHIKSSLVGASVNLIISGGKALLGTWQSVFLCEFDGPRTRKVWVEVK
jgi:secondary thiamine-phosphate synthase enzyme